MITNTLGLFVLKICEIKENSKKFPTTSFFHSGVNDYNYVIEENQRKKYP